MKIIQIGPYPLDKNCIKGGVEASIYGLTQELGKSNEVLVVDVPRRDLDEDKIANELNSNICVARFKSVGGNNNAALKRIPSIIKLIRNTKPNICHIHSTSLFSLILFLYLKIFKTPTIVTVHGLAHIEKKNDYRKEKSFRNLQKLLIQSFAEFLLLSLNKMIIVDTEYVANEIRKYRKQYKIWRNPTCEIIPQGINEVFYNIQEQIVPNRVLSVGALSKRKGHVMLIEAISIVKEQIPEIQIAIVGALSQQNYYEIMLKKIVELNLEENITVIPNAEFDKVLNLYSEASLFVLHSEEESQGIVFCEALAIGKPIVATNVGGIPCVVENGKNGMLSNFGDVVAFAKNIVTILTDEKLQQTIRKNNKVKAEMFHWSIISKRIFEIYKRI